MNLCLYDHLFIILNQFNYNEALQTTTAKLIIEVLKYLFPNVTAEQAFFLFSPCIPSLCCISIYKGKFFVLLACANRFFFSFIPRKTNHLHTHVNKTKSLHFYLTFIAFISFTVVRLLLLFLLLVPGRKKTTLFYISTYFVIIQY